MKIRPQWLGKGKLVLIAGAMLLGCSDYTQKVTNFNQLVFAEEFDTNGSPNSAIWGYDIGRGQNGWGNNELQFYTDRSKNVTVKDGNLVITAEKESFNGAEYTSARLITKGKFQQAYGRFEARMRCLGGRACGLLFGCWGSDIDTKPWPNCGEIDIMEFRGQNPSTVLGTVHGPGYSAGQSIGKSYTLKNGRFDTEFHIFGVEWGPKYINFYVDNVLYNQITPANVPGEWVFEKPFYLLLNLAVGGGFVGSPNSETVFPQTFLIDYVRVYN